MKRGKLDEEKNTVLENPGKGLTLLIKHSQGYVTTEPKKDRQNKPQASKGSLPNCHCYSFSGELLSSPREEVSGNPQQRLSSLADFRNFARKDSICNIPSPETQDDEEAKVGTILSGLPATP
ncbi:unnamed protein product [Caretta caretta]